MAPMFRWQIAAVAPLAVTGPASPEIVEFTITADGQGLIRTQQAVIAALQ